MTKVELVSFLSAYRDDTEILAIHKEDGTTKPAKIEYFRTVQGIGKVLIKT